MKKINLSVGFIFLTLAVLFTIDIVWHVSRGDHMDWTSYASTIFIFILAFVYLRLGFTTDRRQENRINQLTTWYNKLLDIYEEIRDSQNKKDALSMNLFKSGVEDFSEIVFDILTSSYRQDLKDKVDQMHQDLLKKLAKLE